MTLALPDFQHNLKQNIIDATDKKGKKIQLDIIQYLKNAFTSYYMPPIKENTVRKHKTSYRHHSKNGSKGDAIRKMHTICSSTQMNFTSYTNLVGLKWGRLSQIYDKIFCRRQIGSS